MTDEVASFYLSFEGLSTADANIAAAELRETLERSGSGIRVQTIKERPETQDFGATLVLVLGTEAAIILSKAIYAYVAKRGDKVVLKTPEGTVLATGDAAKNIDVAATTAAIKARGDER